MEGSRVGLFLQPDKSRLSILLDENVIGALPIPEASFPTENIRFVVDLKTEDLEVKIMPKGKDYIPKSCTMLMRD